MYRPRHKHQSGQKNFHGVLKVGWYSEVHQQNSKLCILVLTYAKKQIFRPEVRYEAGQKVILGLGTRQANI